MANPTLDVSLDHLVVDNVRTVTYFRRTADGVYTPTIGTTVTGALKRVLSREMMSGPSGSLLVKETTTWHLWVALLGGIVPKYGDVVQEAGGARYTVLDAKLETVGSRYRLDTIRER